MMINWVHPGILFIVAAGLLPFISPRLLGGKARQAFLVSIPVLAIVCVANMQPGQYGSFEFLEKPVIFGHVDRLSLVFAWVFTLMSLIGTVYALHVKKTGELIAAFLYVGSSLGVVFAGDYFSLFIFWEIMAFASAYLIFANRNATSTGAGFRYLLVHITGGVCLLGGIIIHYHTTGSLLFGPIEHDGSLAFYLILAGFLLNAAVPPLNAWLTDAYPEATITGAVFMCAFTTKTAIYVLIRGFPGTELLVWLGAIMALYGVIYAVLENDCRRLLSYHIISQVGYMITAIGIGTQMALNGASAHAFAHILYKGLLFMGAGAVIYMTGKRKLTELGGLYKTMPITLMLYMVGAVSISAFPLFSGFVTKSMIVSAAELDHRALVSLALVLASAGTFLHTGLKLPYYMFFGKDQGLAAKEPPLNMLIAMSIAAIACLLIGLFPHTLYALLPYPVEYEPYTGAHITGALSMLIFTALGFFLFLKHLDPENTISLDTDWFYRKGAAGFMWIARHPVTQYENAMREAVNTLILRPIQRLAVLGLNLDKSIIDGIVNGVATLVLACGKILRRLQNGRISHYALVMVLGIVVGFAWFAT